MKKASQLFKQEMKVVNMGLEVFAESLADQKVKVVHMDWKPTAGGSKKFSDLLKKMR